MKWIIPTLLILTSIALGGNVPELQTKNVGSVLHVQYFDAGKKILTTYYTGVEVYDAQNLKQLHSISLDGYYYDRKKIAISEDFNQLFIAGHNTFKVYNLQDGSLIYQKKFSDYFNVESMQFFEFEKKLQVVCERSNGLSQQGYKLFAWFKDTYDLVGKKYIMSKQTIDPQERKYDHGGCTSIDKQWSLVNESRGYGIKKNGITVSHFNFNFYDKNEPRCAFSPDDTQLIVAGREFVVYDINESRSRIPSILAQEPIQKIGIARDKMLLQGDNLYIGWDLKTGRELWRNISQKTMCHDCSPDPDHVLLNHLDRAFIKPSYAGGLGVFVGGTGGLMDLDMNTGLFKPLEVDYVGSLQVDRDDKRFAVGSGDGTVRVYDTDTFKMIASFKGDPGQAYVGGFDSPSMFMSQDGKKVIHRYQGHFNGVIRILNIDDNTTEQISFPRYYEEKSYGKIVDLSFDGKFALAVHPYMDTTHIYVINLETQKIISEYSYKGFDLYANCFFENDRDYIVSNSAGQIKRIDIATGMITKEVSFDGLKSIYPIDDSHYLFGFANGKKQIVEKESFKVVCTFQLMSFEDGEWIFLTVQGYFNASSKRVLENLIIDDVNSKRALNDNDMKKYYRSDIVSAILQQKSIMDLETKDVEFTLPEKAEYVNQYYPSMREMYTKEHSPYGLIILASQKNLDDLKLIEQAIEETNSSDLKSDLYRSMGNFEQKDILPFLLRQLENSKNSSDQVSILSLIKDMDVRVQKVQELSSKKILSEQAMIWVTTWAREKDCILFEPYFWTAVEKNVRIRNEVVINYLIKKDPKRLKNIWIPYAQKTLENGDDFDAILRLKNIIPYLYKLNPTKTITLLTNPRYKFYVYLFEEIRDPALKDILLSHLINKGNIDSKVFNILVSYHDQVVNQKMIDMIQQIDCKKIYKRLKEKIERDLNITLPCVN